MVAIVGRVETSTNVRKQEINNNDLGPQNDLFVSQCNKSEREREREREKEINNSECQTICEKNDRKIIPGTKLFATIQICYYIYSLLDGSDGSTKTKSRYFLLTYYL